MSRGYVAWRPGVSVPAPPYLDDGEPERAPEQPGAQGEEWLVSVARFPDGPTRGILWEAKIEAPRIRDQRLGPNQLTVTVPTSDQSMRLLGDLIPNATDDSGALLHHVKKAVAFELIVGSTLDGKARHRFVVRDQVTVTADRVTMTGVGFVGGVTSDRVIGAPQRLNLIRTNRSFERGNLSGWRKVGDAEAGVARGGPDGDWCAWVTGTPGFAWIERSVSYSQPPRPWGRQRIAGQAYVKLPTGLDIDDYGLVTIAVYSGGVQVWPDPRRGDPEAGVVTSDMVRGSWHQRPVVGIGYLPTPPYTADVRLRLHPVSTTERTWFDGDQIFRRENTSTVQPVDLIRHPGQLFNHAQRGRDKSSWGITVVEGTPTGVLEVGTWWHEDGQPMNEALNALVGRGMEIWDLPGPARRVKVSKRRGRVRRDLRINPWDILGEVSWTVDPGAQRTAGRAVSQAGSVWGGADEGLKLTGQALGQVLDVTLQGPVGMTPEQLRSWLREQLSGLALLPATSTLLLRFELGMRLEVGDTVRVLPVAGSAAHPDWMRITEWVPDVARRFVAVQVGTDPDLGGRL